MIRFIVLLALLVIAGSAHAQNNPGVSPNQMFGCNQSAIYDASTNGATLLVAADTTGSIYVCGFDMWSAGTVNVALVYGTTVSTPCDTNQTKITPAFQFTAQTGLVDHLPVYTGLKAVPVGSNLCILTTQGVAVQAIAYYTQFP